MPDEPEPSFEQALSQLERIVTSLERGEPELTAALAQYEQGVRLLTQCHRLLDQAEQSVAVLTGVDEAGNARTVAFDATATIARDASSASQAGADVSTTATKKRKSPDRSAAPKPSVSPPSDSFADSDPPY
jgi:exodeoxyribonuclease VII small subunit